MTRTRPQGPRKQRARKRARGGDKLLDGTQQWNATCREILLPRYIELRYVTFISRAPAFIPRPPLAFACPPYTRTGSSLAPSLWKHRATRRRNFFFPPSFLLLPPFGLDVARDQNPQLPIRPTDLPRFSPLFPSPSFPFLFLLFFANIMHRAGPCNSRGF